MHTGILITKDTIDKTASIMKAGVEVTEVLREFRLVEPISGKYMDNMVSIYGQQNGRFYTVHLEEQDDIDINQLNLYNVYFNKSNFQKRISYNEDTQGASKDKMRLMCLDLMFGGLGINQKELICVTSN